MAVYEYVAKNLDGKKVHGRMQAAGEEQVYQSMKASGLFVIECREIRGKTSKRQWNSRYLAEFSDQLGVMLGSGITLLQAVNILQQREHNGKMVGIYQNLYEALVKGNSLSAALEQQGDVFPPMMIHMFRAGEECGRLDKAAACLSKFYREDNRLKQKVAGALVYPVFLLILTIVSLIFLFTAVLPEFFTLFASIEELPVSTRILRAISIGLLEHGGTLLLLTVAVSVVICYVVQKKEIRRLLGKLLLKLPIVGKLFKVIYTARFARIVSSLYSNGLELVKALSIAVSMIENVYIEEQFTAVLEDVRDGASLSAALSAVDGFDDRLITSIYIGEESGALNVVLVNLADGFDYEAEEATKRLITLIEPVMIVVLAVIIGYIMISVMIPIYQYYQTIG